MTTTKKPQTERVCECGHPEFAHLTEDGDCYAFAFVAPPGFFGAFRRKRLKICPCPAFTPKKEN